MMNQTLVGLQAPVILPSYAVYKDEGLSEFEIERELEVSRVECLYWQPKTWQRLASRAKERIDLAYIGAIEQIECLDHKIELAVLADWQVLEEAQVDSSKRWGLEPIAHETRRARRNRESVAPV